MIPAARTYFLLFSGLLLGVGIANFSSVNNGLLATAIFDCLIISLALIDKLKNKPDRIKIHRLPLGKLSIGRDNPVILSVTSSQKAAKVCIYDHYPREFTHQENHQAKLPLEIDLPSNTQQEISYNVHPQKRGEFLWGGIQVRQLGAWGLAWDNWQVSSNTKALVYPDLVGLRQLTVKLTLENSGAMKRSRRLGIGTEFAELREYRMGDDPRLIDWKATARRATTLATPTLQVRVLEPEQEQTLIILLDRGRLMTAQVQGLARFDWGLQATLSLAVAGLHRGDRVGVGVFDRKMHTWLPPERGQQQLSHLVESLTPIQPELLEPDYVGAVTHLVKQQSRRALIVLITDIIDSTASKELLAALGRLTPRYLPFCVTLRDPEVDRISVAEQYRISVAEQYRLSLGSQSSPNQAAIPNLRAAYSQAVALDLLNQRQVAFAQLKQKGVLVLDAPVQQISDQLVDRYLQLKAKNLL